MSIRGITIVLAALAIGSAGCDRSARLLRPTPTGPLITEVLTGTVAPPVNGTFQSTFRPYVVLESGGEVKVTLTSAVLTRPDGTQQTTIAMGLGAGTMVNGTCVVPVTAFVTTVAGPVPQLQGSLDAGTYCIQVSDVSGLAGPVAFSVTVTHF
jgi:hypothetical protein